MWVQMQNSEYVAKMLEYMSSEACSDEQFNEVMAGIEAKLNAKGITVEAVAVEEET
jgi:hypothetical protein